jgi:uncharacterized protein DUF222/HNH endonuclease
MPTEAPLALAMDALHVAIERFCEHPIPETGPELASGLARFRHGIDLLELRFSEFAAAFAATDEYDSQGSVSPIHWIRVNCHMGGGAAADRVAVGTQLSQMPESVETMAEGEIGFAHLAMIARTATSISEESAKPFDEAPLLDKARHFSVGRFRDICHHARHAADPEGYAGEQAEGVESRSLTITGGDRGMVWVRGVLDAEGGATLRTALEPLARRSGTGDSRSRDRRLADAAIELAAFSLNNGLVPQRASQRAHLQVTTTLETLLARCGAPAADLEFSVPISAASVERLACDCNVTRILLGSDSAVIDVGRSRRLLSPATRRALNVRDRGCRWPGCDRPASWTSGHHLVHWTKGGPTDLDNLALLCYRHHWMVHEGRWQLVKADDGRLVTVPPTFDFYKRLARGPGRRSV